MIKCPVCHELMLVLETDRIEVDYCVVCRGIWLDAGELEMLLDDAEHKERFLTALKPVSRSSEKKKRCPICRKKMNKISFEHKGKIVVDSCPGGHGIWFDRGELAQALTEGGLAENRRIFQLLENMFTDRAAE